MTPAMIKQARLDAGLTPAQAAALVHRSLRNWYQWESGERPVDLAAWELFTIKTSRSESETKEKGK